MKLRKNKKKIEDDLANQWILNDYTTSLSVIHKGSDAQNLLYDTSKDA